VIGGNKRSLLLAICMVLGLAGCGGGDETTTVVQQAPETTEEMTTTTTSQSSEVDADEFRAEADGICKRVNEQLADIASAKEAEALLRDALAKVQEIDPPPELEVQWKQYLQAVEQQIDFEFSGQQQESQRARDRKSQIALDLGLVECGTG
jgi:hypothetical protein